MLSEFVRFCGASRDDSSFLRKLFARPDSKRSWSAVRQLAWKAIRGKMNFKRLQKRGTVTAGVLKKSPGLPGNLVSRSSRWSGPG
jgi:hypothetical protein